MTIKVLVLDRDGHVQSMMKDVLTPLECQVVPASSTALAVFLARKNFPSLIVLNSTDDDDLELPQDLANDEDLKHIPVLVLASENEFERFRQRVSTTRAVRLIACPSKPQELRSLLVPYLCERLDERETETTE